MYFKRILLWPSWGFGVNFLVHPGFFVLLDSIRSRIMHISPLLDPSTYSEGKYIQQEVEPQTLENLRRAKRVLAAASTIKHWEMVYDDSTASNRCLSCKDLVAPTISGRCDFYHLRETAGRLQRYRSSTSSSSSTQCSAHGVDCHIRMRIRLLSSACSREPLMQLAYLSVACFLMNIFVSYWLQRGSDKSRPVFCQVLKSEQITN